MAKDYYQILGLEKNASKEEVKKAFHKLAHQYHPDKSEGNEGKFKEINEAYQVLFDDRKRKEYDTYGQTFSGGTGPEGFGFDPSGFQDFDFGNLNDIFSDFFSGGMGGMGGRESSSSMRRGRDISTELHIDFKDSVFGTTRNILITKTSTCEKCKGSGGELGTGTKKCDRCNGQGKIHETKKTFFGAFSSVKVCDECLGVGSVPKEKCSTCRGAGVVKKQEEIRVIIPAGIKDGEIMRMTGMGEAVSRGETGDLYIKINVAKDSTFQREGENLVMNLNIKLSDALLGAEYIIDTLDGKLAVKIPEGVSFGEVLRVKEKGVQISKTRRGDLLIKLNIKLPTKLNKATKDLIEKLKNEGI